MGRMLSIAAAVCLLAGSASAASILDASFFDPITHTLINFDTDGAGEQIFLNDFIPNNYTSMPAAEYAAQGVTFSQDLQWVNEPEGSSFDAAQAIGGSPDISIPGPPNDDFYLYFSGTVKAFGFFVINKTTNLVTPAFSAYDATGGLIETVSFTESFIDGTTGTAAYGFMGIESEVPIASVRIAKDSTALDDLRFSAIPEPASLVLLGLGSLAMLRRRGA